MATYVYDDYRVTLTPRADGAYDASARGPDGVDHVGVFQVPFAEDELERAVLGVARTRVRSTSATTRDVGGVGPPALDAEALGAALAAALLTSDIAAGYDGARRQAMSAGRGLRLTLSLGAAPSLLSLPWELLYRRPRFFANQRQTPLVRHLETTSLPQPPAIDSTVRILGVVASPSDCGELEVDVERDRVASAVAKMVALGRVQLDWLEPATRRGLREALRDGSYHVLHYVGHSDFTPAGEGVLYLEDAEGKKAQVDSTELANLLADQTSLRLVVLNSCEGARTTLTDPYAGVATTLMQLGVPAVVAMQFEISDEAAVLFAAELYTNLIGRQDPINAAVAEARKAMYIELGTVEWATPVLFMGDVDVELFHFEVAAAPLPPPPPPELTAPMPLAGSTPAGAPPSPPPPAPAPASPTSDEGAPPGPRRAGSILVKAIVGIVGLIVLVLLVAFLAGAVSELLGGDDDDGTEVTTPAAVASDPAATTPAAGEAPVVEAGAALAAPVHFTGTIDDPEGVDDHLVELAERQIVYLRGSGECGVDVEYVLLSPTGTELTGAPYVCADNGRIVAPMSGEYTVRVRSWNGGTGPYDIEVVPVPADDVADAALDEPLVGELTVPGEQDLYRFVGAAGDIVYINGSGPCGVSVDYILISPSRLDLTGAPYACEDIGRIELPQSGEYTLAVRSWEGGVGGYKVAVAPVPPDEVSVVAVGDRLEGELTAPGEQHVYLFDASAGDVVVLEGEGPCGVNVDYVLLSPADLELTGAPYACDDIGEVELPQTGEYAVLVASWEGGTGPYQILLRSG